MSYVDGFVLPVPKKNLPAYKKMATIAGAIWRDHGALDYKECVLDDPDTKGMCLPFTDLQTLKRGDVVVFAFITFKSRAHRDKVNAKVMKDERMNDACKDRKMPFDPKRMFYSGFNVLVDA